MRKKIISLALIFSQLFLYVPYSKANEEVECGTKLGYELYKCRVKKACDEYKPKKIIYEIKKEDDYTKASSPEELKEAKEKYRKNMNNIYKCAILKTQKKSLNHVIDLLDPDKSGQITDKVEKKIKSRINRIEKISNSEELGCNFYENEKLNDKLTVLNQTTYEICRYTNYLEYIRDYNSNLQNILGISKDKIDEIKKTGNKETEEFLENKKYSLEYITVLKKEKETEVDVETENSFKVFPLAYHAYSEYENNFIIHILLELIREDFIDFRNKLHKTLGPVSQLVYKISNAMSK